MKKIIYVFVILISIFILLFLVSRLVSNKNEIEKVQYDFVGAIHLDTCICRTYHLSYNLSSLEKILMEYCEYDSTKDSLIQSLDFNQYDYVITYQRKATEIEYDKNYAKKNDQCEYIKNLKPIKVLYSEQIFKIKYLFIKFMKRKNIDTYVHRGILLILILV